MGIFGNPASIIVDVNLIIQWVIFVILLVGYLKRGERKTHGYLMVFAIILNLITVLSIMAPSLIMNLSTLPPTVFGHVIIGDLAILLGLVFSFKFLRALRNSQPLICGTRREMLIAIALWIVPIFLGTLLYMTLYVL